MKKIHYNTHKFGNLIISRIGSEITILRKGKNGIRSKTISIRFLSAHKGLLSTVFLLVFSLGLGYYVYNNIDFHSFENTAEKDENQKIEQLLSSKTDFSDQKSQTLKIREHIVKDGDTLTSLAKEYGVSMDTICGSNKLQSYDFIQTGKKLLIPNKDGIIYEIKKGQTVIDIAKNYKVSADKIISENSMKNSDFISAGDVIFIPDAKPLDIIPGFLWPAQAWRITSTYGWRRDPINGMKLFHEGLDIRSVYQAVKATKYGKVAYAGWMGGYGNAVVIAHLNGWKSVYGHLSKIYVKSGQYVRQGQSIAKSGDTGYSTGPHLHFELIKDGVHYDPYKYLKR